MAKKHKDAEDKPAASETKADGKRDPNEGQTVIAGAEPPPFVPIVVLRDRYLSALAAEAGAGFLRMQAEHTLAERVAANKNKPYPIVGADGVERKYRSRCRKGADPKEIGSLALSEIGASAPTTGTEY